MKSNPFPAGTSAHRAAQANAIMAGLAKHFGVVKNDRSKSFIRMCTASFQQVDSPPPAPNLAVIWHRTRSLIQEQFPAAEIERAMKIQEVILKAMAGKLKWWEAAEII